MTMDELKYVDGKFTVNGIDVSNVSATTEINESVQEISANTQQFSVFEDPEERFNMELDSESRVLSYRDKNGIKNENILRRELGKEERKEDEHPE